MKVLEKSREFKKIFFNIVSLTRLQLEMLHKGYCCTLTTWREEPTHWKRPWCWERLRVGGEGGDRVWDGWMASSTQWTWMWPNSRWYEGQGSLVCCSPCGCRDRHDWVAERQWNSAHATLPSNLKTLMFPHFQLWFTDSMRWKVVFNFVQGQLVTQYLKC